MPKLSLSQPYSIEQSVLRERIAAMEDKLRNKYRANTAWVDDSTMTVEGPGVQGRLRIDETSVHIDLDLGFLLAPLKGKIEGGLARELVRVTSVDG